MMQGAFFVVLLGFEPRFSEPESDVVPLHYKTIRTKPEWFSVFRCKNTIKMI